MGDFGPIVFVLARSMDHRREDVSMRSPVTPQLVGDQLPEWSFLMLQHLTKETRCCSTVSTLRNENIDYVSILIDSSPQIEVLSSDFEEEFIDVPDIAEPHQRQKSGGGAPVLSRSAGAARVRRARTNNPNSHSETWKGGM